MTKSQLKQFYSFAKLPYSEAPHDLGELKKILLLELKSIGDTLKINGKSWSKNDILDFFNSDFDNSLDLELFLREYPWIRNLDAIDKIPYNSYLSKIDFSDERFAMYAKTEGKVKENEFLRIFKNRIIAQEDYYAAALLLYKHCFSSVFQLRLMNEARAILLNRFNEIIALGENKKMSPVELAKKANYITNSGFYILMKEVAHDDSELLYQNIKVIYPIFSGLLPTTIYKIISDQLTLNHDDNCVDYLNQMKEGLQKQVANREEKASEKSQKTNQIRYKVFFIAMGLISTIFIFVTVQGNKRTQYMNEFIESPGYKKFKEDLDRDLDSTIKANEINTIEITPTDDEDLFTHEDFLLQIDSMKKARKQSLNNIDYERISNETYQIMDSIKSNR